MHLYLTLINGDFATKNANFTTLLRGNGNTNLVTGNGNRINLTPAIFQGNCVSTYISRNATVNVFLAVTALCVRAKPDSGGEFV